MEGPLKSAIATAVACACERFSTPADLARTAHTAAAAAALASLKSGSSTRDAARVGVFTGVVTAGGTEDAANESSRVAEEAVAPLLVRSRSTSVAAVLGRTSGNWGVLGRVLADVVRDTCGVEMFERLEKSEWVWRRLSTCPSLD